MPSFISDGFNRSAFILPSVIEDSGERLHEGMEFTYRPATRLDNARVDAEVAIAFERAKFDPEAAVKAELVVCEFVKARVISWNLKNGVHPVAVSVDACGRINPYLFSALYEIIRGVRVSDKKPEAKEEPKLESAEIKNSETVSG